MTLASANAGVTSPAVSIVACRARRRSYGLTPGGNAAWSVASCEPLPSVCRYRHRPRRRCRPSCLNGREHRPRVPLRRRAPRRARRPRCSRLYAPSRFHGRLIRFAVDRETGTMVAQWQRHVRLVAVRRKLPHLRLAGAAAPGIDGIAGIARIANFRHVRTVGASASTTVIHVSSSDGKNPRKIRQGPVAYFCNRLQYAQTSARRAMRGSLRLVRRYRWSLGGFGQQSCGVVDFP